MKTVETLLSMPILASFIAGANIVAGSETTQAASNGGVEGVSSAAPILALCAVTMLLASGLYFMACELRMEAIDQRRRRNF